MKLICGSGMFMARRISVQSAKAKGRKLQNWVAEHISNILNISYGKDEDIESRPSGQTGVDVILHGKARDRFPFAIECKNQEKMNLYAWVKQAKANKPDWAITWLLFHTRNNEKQFVTMDAEEFFKLYERILNG